MAVAKILVPARELGSSKPPSPTRTCAGIAARMLSKAATDAQMGIEREVNRKRAQYTASRILDERVRACFDSFNSAVDTDRGFSGNSAIYGLPQMDLKLRFPWCRDEHIAL